MAIDFNLPIVTTAYTAVLTYIRDNIIAALKMDFTGAANIPTGTIRWNATTKRFETYNGTGWDELETEYAINVATLQGNAASAFATAGHGHTIGNVSGLQSALDGETATRAAADTSLQNQIDSVSGKIGTFVNAADGGAYINSGYHGVLATGGWESVGPTGSGADNVWAALDAVESGADWIEVRIDNYAQKTSGTWQSFYQELYIRKYGGTGTGNPVSEIGGYGSSTQFGQSKTIASHKIPIDANAMFEEYQIAYNISGGSHLRLFLLGWGFNS